MSIWDTFKEVANTVIKGVKTGAEKTEEGIHIGVQGTTDLITGGLPNIENRKTLDGLKGQERDLLATYNSEQPEMAAWVSPLNDTANIVTSMLQRTSDYVQGIAFSYGQALSMSSVSISMIAEIEKAGFSLQKFLDFSLPSEVCEVPSSLIPGLNSAIMFEGILNSLADSATLDEQISTAHDNIDKIDKAIADVRDLRAKLMTLKDYLLSGIGTQALTVYQQTTGLKFDPMPLKADTTQSLMDLNDDLVKLCERLEKINGNTFMIFRILLRLLESGKIAGGKVTDAQLDYLVRMLTVLPDIQVAFPDQSLLRQFVANFFQGKLAVAPTFLKLPPMPDSITSLVKQTPSQKTNFDMRAPKYAPPGNLDFDNIPQ